MDIENTQTIALHTYLQDYFGIWLGVDKIPQGLLRNEEW
jgi:hypothetical protein